jgi:hypothetical protein
MCPARFDEGGPLRRFGDTVPLPPPIRIHKIILWILWIRELN